MAELSNETVQGWVAKVRIAASWHTGQQARVLETLADEMNVASGGEAAAPQVPPAPEVPSGPVGEPGPRGPDGAFIAPEPPPE